jgi:hypothetical protein
LLTMNFNNKETKQQKTKKKKRLTRKVLNKTSTGTKRYVSHLMIIIISIMTHKHTHNHTGVYSCLYL